MTESQYRRVENAARLCNRTVSDWTRLVLEEISSDTLAALRTSPFAEDDGRRKKLIDKLLGLGEF